METSLPSFTCHDFSIAVRQATFIVSLDNFNNKLMKADVNTIDYFLKLMDANVGIPKSYLIDYIDRI